MDTRCFISNLLLVCSFLLAAPQALSAQCDSKGARSSVATLASENSKPSIVDPQLQREWKIVIDCQHPERPGVMVAAPFNPDVRKSRDLPRRAGAFTSEQQPEVAEGGPVVVRRTDSQTHAEFQGTSVRSGRIGERVAVRLTNGVLVEGRVSGTALVELELPQNTWRQP